PVDEEALGRLRRRDGPVHDVHDLPPDIRARPRRRKLASALSRPAAPSAGSLWSFARAVIAESGRLYTEAVIFRSRPREVAQNGLLLLLDVYKSRSGMPASVLDGDPPKLGEFLHAGAAAEAAVARRL